jgi:hypothetical protein
MQQSLAFLEQRRRIFLKKCTFFWEGHVMGTATFAERTKWEKSQKSAEMAPIDNFRAK